MYHFGGVPSRIAQVGCEPPGWGSGVPHGELSPHQLFASFSITAGPICPKLSHYTRSICPQTVLEFDGILMGTAEVGFGVPHGEVWGSWGTFSPSAVCFVLHNGWADCPQTFTLYSLHMPADGIRVWSSSGEK